MSDQIEHLTKHELLDQIRAEHGHLEETLADLTHAQMQLPGVDGDWSVKDALAHISAWERCMIRWVGSLLRNEEPAIPLPWDVDRMNAETYTLVKDKPLAEVLEEFRQSYRDSLAFTESRSEEQLQTVHADTWPMGLLWTGIAANTNWHYKEHHTDIQKWLKIQKKER
jgi:hypothetical protein